MKAKVMGVGILVLSSSALMYNNRDMIISWLDKNIGRIGVDAMGYLGGAGQLGAVMAVSRGWLSNTSNLYHGISLIGSSGLLITAYYHGAMAPSLVNIIWMGMNTLGILEGVSNMEAFAQLTEGLHF